MEFILNKVPTPAFVPVVLTLTFTTQADLDRFTTLIGNTKASVLPESHELYDVLTDRGGRLIVSQDDTD